jgi:hypothetical protein
MEAARPIWLSLSPRPLSGSVSRLAMAPTIVTSSPSRIQTVPSPITTSQCQRDQGSRSSRPGIRVSMVPVGTSLTRISWPLCLAVAVTRAGAEQTGGPVAWDG